MAVYEAAQDKCGMLISPDGHSYQPECSLDRDSRDLKDRWVMMTVFGKFERGYPCLPDLDVRVPFQRGDTVIFRSALLEHYITASKGQRYSVVFFIKESVVKYAKDST